MTNPDQTGCVVESYGRRVVVACDGFEPRPCKLARRNLELVAGDDVVIAMSPGDDEWTVIERLPRRNLFCRSDSRGRPESLAANLDQLAVVIAPLPECDPFMVDRYLAGAEQAGIAVMLVVNKLDLPAGDGDLSFVDPLRAAGLPVVSVPPAPARDSRDWSPGCRGAAACSRGSRAWASPASQRARRRGVALRRATVDGNGGRPAHHRVFRDPEDASGEIADSRAFVTTRRRCARQDVQRGYVEVAALGGGCRFQDCLHLREPQCAVRAAVESGVIDARR